MKTILTLPFLCAAVAAQGVPQKPTTPFQPAPLQKTAPMAVAKSADQPTLLANPTASTPVKPQAADLTQATPSPFAATDLLLFDAPRPGQVWVRGHDYKAGFTAAGIEFLAAPPVPTLPSGRVELALRAARVAGTALPLVQAAPTRDGNRITWQRGALSERVDVASDHIEQSFAIASLPARGELVLELAVATDLQGEDLGDGIRFHGAAEVLYTEAVAIDANGNRVHAETRLDGDRITIQVPAAFVATAALPLVIDPIVQTTSLVSNTAQLGHPDVAWDDYSNSWAVTYDHVFSANDTDVYLQRFGADLLPIGNLVTIDFTGAVWETPKIANNWLIGSFLVVAQVNSAHQGYQWISGRLCDNQGVTQAAFDIEKNGIASHGTGKCYHPDVAGDPCHYGPTYFTVVWEEEYAGNAADHDIAMKQVRTDGTLKAAAPVWVASSGANESQPSISKSAGGGDFAYQVLAVTWQHAFSASDEDIYASIFTWDGVLVPIGGAPTLAINTSTANDLHPVVSTSTLGNGTRRFLVAYERPAAGNGQVVATCFTSTGTLLNTAVVQTNQNWAASEPTVDCDGARFAVARTYLFSGSGLDTDVQLTLLNWNGSTLQVQDTTYPANHFSPENQPALASEYSGSGEAGMRYALVDTDHDAATWRIEAVSYDGYGAGSVTTRPTGCGNLGITMNGVPALGETVLFQVANNHPLTGVLLGFPVTVPIPTCPMCTMGVNGSAVIANPTPLVVPADAGLIGLLLSAQGFTFGGGPCLSTISASDTIDFTIR